MESFVRCVLVLLWVSFNWSSSAIVTTEGEELANYGRAGGNTIDLTTSGDAAYLYVRLCDWELLNTEGEWIVKMTRYCYCTESKSLDPAHRSCSYPGPTLLMHSYTNVTVWLVNELVGNATTIDQRKFLENFTLSDISLIEHRNWSGLVDKFNIGIFEVDSSQEFVINNNNSHVYHQHINPFQVMHNVGGNGFIALKCTWWDSLGNYVNEGAGIGDTVTVKTWTRGHWLASTTETENPFLGKITDCFFGTGGGLVINHCHLLQHEGMAVHVVF